ncbi:MAG: tetratricopeptide repeat protein [Armatimonadetes bacterium]|nr:tetratricopeptide repeat protein [Armatimonadota bacterium]
MNSHADHWLASARELLANRQFRAAIEAAEEARRQGAAATECLRIQAEAQLGLGRVEEAQKVLGDLAAADPQDAWALKTLAMLHEQAGRPAKAMALLEQAAAIAPEDREIQERIAALRSATAAQTPSQLPERRRNLAPVIGLVVALDILVIAGILAWLMLSRQGKQSAVAERVPVADSGASISQVTPTAEQGSPVTAAPQSQAAGQPVAEVQAPQQQAQPLAQTQPEDRQGKAVAEVAPQDRQARPMQEVAPQSKPRLKLLWLRCVPEPRMTVRDMGKIRRVYIMYGEVLNDSDVPCEVAVIRGRLLARSQAAGYGLAELGQIPPHGTARFQFYAYQLADENAPAPDNYDAMVIPGFGLSSILEQMGLGPELEQMIESGQAPEY